MSGGGHYLKSFVRSADFQFEGSKRRYLVDGYSVNTAAMKCIFHISNAILIDRRNMQEIKWLLNDITSSGKALPPMIRMIIKSNLTLEVPIKISETSTRISISNMNFTLNRSIPGNCYFRLLLINSKS